MSPLERYAAALDRLFSACHGDRRPRNVVRVPDDLPFTAPASGIYFFAFNYPPGVTDADIDRAANERDRDEEDNEELIEADRKLDIERAGE